MIILDYSQVALANIFQFQDQLMKGRSNPDAVNIIRHAILTGIKYYKKRYGAQYGEIVLACDGQNYWRKDIFEYYKAKRKTDREKSPLDWKLIFDTMSTIRDEIAEHFPYRVVRVDSAEADDVIASLCKWTQTDGLIDHGVYEVKQPVLIVSGDNDFLQLQKYDNVKQYSPSKKKLLDCKDPAAYLREHIACAGDDGIPNVLSPDNVFVTPGARQGKMTAAKKEKFIALGRDACENEDQLRNWDRNNQLINLDLIPLDLQQLIIDTYINGAPKGNKMTIYNYLVQNRCRLLLDDIEEF